MDSLSSISKSHFIMVSYDIIKSLELRWGETKQEMGEIFLLPFSLTPMCALYLI